jgi:hypothetical protein
MTGLRRFLALILLTATAFPAFAADGMLFPVVPKAKGGQCVEDTQFMRRNHMDLLKHQRDATLREGVRGAKHSLKDCIACHAVDDAKGQPVGIDDKNHFCNSCHEYAAVQIDCFSCHTSKPEAPAKQAAR